MKKDSEIQKSFDQSANMILNSKSLEPSIKNILPLYIGMSSYTPSPNKKPLSITDIWAFDFEIKSPFKNIISSMISKNFVE